MCILLKHDTSIGINWSLLMTKKIIEWLIALGIIPKLGIRHFEFSYDIIMNSYQYIYKDASSQ